MNACTQLSYIVIIMSVVIGFGIMISLYYYLRHHTLIIRDPLSDTASVKSYWVTENLDKQTGIVWWKTIPLHPRLSIPKPPNKCLNVGARGRLVAEAYKISEDEYVYIQDKGINIIETTEKGKKVLKIAEVTKDGKHQLVDTFKPFSAVQRDVLINQYQKANKLGQDRWTKNDIMNLALVSLMAMIIVVGIVFSGDIFKGISDNQQATNTGIKEATKLIQSVQRVGGDLKTTQVVEAETTTGEVIEGSEKAPIE